MAHSTLVAGAHEFISNHAECCVAYHSQRQQKALHASVAYKKNEVIVSFSAAETFNQPTYLTIQIGDNKHISLAPSFLQYTNHSCRPNVFFDTTRMEFIALQDIEAGEELCFFYPSTEWEMAEAFQCNCGQTECLLEIKGARFLTDEQIDRYKLTDFIQQQLASRK